MVPILPRSSLAQRKIGTGPRPRVGKRWSQGLGSNPVSRRALNCPGAAQGAEEGSPLPRHAELQGWSRVEWGVRDTKVPERACPLLAVGQSVSSLLGTQLTQL